MIDFLTPNPIRLKLALGQLVAEFVMLHRHASYIIASTGCGVVVAFIWPSECLGCKTHSGNSVPDGLLDWCIE